MCVFVCVCVCACAFFEKGAGRARAVVPQGVAETDCMYAGELDSMSTETRLVALLPCSQNRRITENPAETYRN